MAEQAGTPVLAPQPPTFDAATPDAASPAVAALPDAVRGQLLFKLAPSAWWPFLQLARLDRPIGWWLLALPCCWSSALASLATHRPLAIGQIALLFLGAIAMRGAGSTYNDIVDRHLDAKVERTRLRPLPSGRVSVRGARAFLVLQALVGLAVVVCFNRFTIVLGIASLAIVAAYPFMKRVTSWPQLVLGLAFAWGGLLGWAALAGALAPAAVWLYAGAVCWTVGYDTVYAVQDARDDPAAGIKSTARLFGGRVRLAVGLIYAGCAVLIEAALFAAGVEARVPAQAGVACFAVHLASQVWRLDAGDGVGALVLFRSNRNAGLILALGLAAATF